LAGQQGHEQQGHRSTDGEKKRPFPPSPTTLVGREREKQAICHLLHQEKNKLVCTTALAFYLKSML
jgi:hypothetical protein